MFDYCENLQYPTNEFSSIAKAAFPDFLSDAEGLEPDTFILEWATRSHTPISVFSVSYRESGEDEWNDLEVKPAEENVKSELKNILH